MLVVVKFTHLILPLPCPDHTPVRKAHRMQWPFDLFLPKFDKFEQARVIWGDIVFLPDKTV